MANPNTTRTTFRHIAEKAMAGMFLPDEVLAEDDVVADTSREIIVDLCTLLARIGYAREAGNIMSKVERPRRG